MKTFSEEITERARTLRRALKTKRRSASTEAKKEKGKSCET